MSVVKTIEKIKDKTLRHKFLDLILVLDGMIYIKENDREIIDNQIKEIVEYIVGDVK